MYKYALGAACPFCHTGIIHTDDARQMCPDCGVILGIGMGLRPFGKIRPGEEFFSGYNVDRYIWRRALEGERLPEHCNCYTLGNETIYGLFDDSAPCIRVEERKIFSTRFGYN